MAKDKKYEEKGRPYVRFEIQKNTINEAELQSDKWESCKTFTNS